MSTAHAMGHTATDADPWPNFLRRCCADCDWTSPRFSERLPIEDAREHFEATGHYTMLGVVTRPDELD